MYHKEKLLEKLDTVWNEQITYYSKIRNYSYDALKAKEYDASETIKKDGIQRANTIKTKFDDTILDIGSGPGTLSIPLAKKVRKITCVEPSEEMISLLKKNIAFNNLSNISIINKKWEDIKQNKIGNHSIVVASYCLVMKNISSLIKKMNAVALKKVYLYWFIGETSWDIFCKDLYPQVFNKKYKGLPKSDVLIDILKTLGYKPTIKTLDSKFPRVYTTINDALNDLKSRLTITTNRFDEMLKTYITNHYRFENEHIYWDDTSNYVEISWNKHFKHSQSTMQ